MKLDLTNLRDKANRLIVISQGLSSNPDTTRAGGVLTLGLEGFSQKLILDIGDYPAQKREKYTHFSQEKAHRAYAHWLRQPEVAVSSWQTRNIQEMMFGGAVLFPQSPGVVSFSGLAELTDEAVSLALGYHLGLTQDPDYARRVIKISQNPIFEALYSKFTK